MTQFGYQSRSSSPALKRINERAIAVKPVEPKAAVGVPPSRPDGFRIIHVLPPSWRQILSEVASRHKLKPEHLIGRSRQQHVSYARQEAMYLIIQRTKLSLPQVAQRMDRDHTTVLHGIRAHATRHGLPPARGCAYVVRNPVRNGDNVRSAGMSHPSPSAARRSVQA